MTIGFESTGVPDTSFARSTELRLRAGDRFAALLALPFQNGLHLTAITSHFGEFPLVECDITPSQITYPLLGQTLPITIWYERKLLDLHQASATVGNRLTPLLAPASSSTPFGLDADKSPEHHTTRPSVVGEGVFQIPLGPVRSGIVESIEYVVETPGEEILHVEARPFYKHRGVDDNFSNISIEYGALLAERVEGVASVAHAIAFCQAIEELSDAEIPFNAQLVRLVHAELERIANHLESAIRLCEASSQAVAYSRLSLHKEEIMRLRSDISGHRFARGVVIPGGVKGPLSRPPNEAINRIIGIEKQVTRDLSMLMRTPSFLDRLRRTGVITEAQARQFGALGPVGRGSGIIEDDRLWHSYGAYQHLEFLELETIPDGDSLSRQNVRIEEISNSFHLIRQSLDRLSEIQVPADWRVELEPKDGISLGWAEAPQGEVLYLVEVENGRISAATQRSASFHNLALFSSAFPKDITTDFAFIEASFGLSIAGASS